MNWRLPLAISIFLAFVVWIETTLGWRQVLSPWQQFPWYALLAASLAMLLSYLLRALRFYDYFAKELRRALPGATFKHGIIRFIAMLRITVTHNFFNNMLPMRTGELAFPLLMKNYFRSSLGSSGSSLLWLRILDLHMLLTLGSAIAAEQLPYDAVEIIAGLWLLLPLLIYLARQALAQRLQNSQRPGGRLALILVESLPAEPGVYLRAWLWTGLNWLCKILVYAWILNFFLKAPIAQAVLGVTSGELSSVLPVHGIAGVGTYEAGVLAGLLPFQINFDQAMQAAINLHLFIIGSTLGLSGLVLLLSQRLASVKQLRARYPDPALRGRQSPSTDESQPS